MSSELFISYAREDRERVQAIADELARRGYTLWWDKGLRTGEDFHDRIEQMLRTARGVVVVWSRYSVESEFVRDEARRGHRRKVLLPVFIDPGIDPPLGFGGIHTTDLSGWLADPSDPAPFDQFAADVAAVLGHEPPPPPPPVSSPAAPRIPRELRIATVAGMLLLAPVAMYLTNRVLGDGPSRTGGPETAGREVESDSTAPPSPALLPSKAACLTLNDSALPIDVRRESLRPPPYSVDTATHLLLNREGEAVPGRGISDYGKLHGRRLIVAHHTAAPPGTAEAYFAQKGASGSVHVLIMADGTVNQLLPFDFASMHAGASRWRDLRNVNPHSIGIDIENLGALTRRDGAWYWARNRRVPAESVMVVVDAAGRERGWHRYSRAQLDAFLQVSCALRRAYPTLEDVVGHEDISPGRKIDPGPAFPLKAIRARLFPGRRPE